MKRLWNRVKPWIERSLRQRITLSGVVFSFVVALVGAAAFISANNLLFLLLAAMLSTLLVSGFVNRLSLAGLEVDFVLPDHVSARRTINGRIRVRNQKRWMPSFSIHLAGSPEAGFGSAVYFPCVPSASAVEETVEVFFNRRGIQKNSNFQFSTRFPFGFTMRRIDVTLSGETLVYPCLDPQPGFEELLTALAGEMARHYRGRGNDFYRIRPYEPFESARHVDWRASAHTGELQVREFAREEEHLIEVFFDLNVTERQHDWFEKAVECCAFLAWRIAERGARIHFRTQDFDQRLPEECDLHLILKYLALVSPRPGCAPLEPQNETSFRLVLTASPSRVEEAGWRGAHMLDLSAFDGASAPTLRLP